MDRKLPFTFNWCPRSEKILTKRDGRFLVSPKFCTVYNNRFFKWRLVIYPNGLPNSVIQKTKDSADEMMEKDSSTNSGCVIFLLMIPLSTVKRGLKAQVDANVEILLV